MSGHVLFKHMKLSRIYFTGRHVQHEDRFYRRACITGRHVLVVIMFFYENVCYGRTCAVGGHVLQVCAECARQ